MKTTFRIVSIIQTAKAAAVITDLRAQPVTADPTNAALWASDVAGSLSLSGLKNVPDLKVNDTVELHLLTAGGTLQVVDTEKFDVVAKQVELPQAPVTENPPDEG
jgi:hypothetical protein